MSDYTAFLRQKIKMASFKGFQVEPEACHPILFPHQRDIVRWAVLGGNRAIFASFGLGKSVMQCEWLRQIIGSAGGLGLIVCPLGVRQELIRDAAMLGVKLVFIRSAAEIVDGQAFYCTNYETIRDGKLDPLLFTAVSLDEASVLRSFGSKTYQEFLPLFEGVRFKLVNTATPSPNRFKELIHYAGFLGVMDTGQALTRFFQRDSEKAGNLTLYPHKEQEFWLWVSSWAVFVQKPSDLGYSDEGYDLPPIEVRYHEVPTDYSQAGQDRDGQVLLFQDPALGLSAAAAEKRDSMPARVAKVAEILAASPADHFVIWHDLEAERHALQAAIPGAVSVWGSQDLEERERRIVAFGDGEFRILSTKPVIAGSGCNFQRHCHREVFAGIGFKFNDFIQAIHRVQRFQQPHPVVIDIVYSEAEREVLRTLQQKWTQHEEMVSNMTEIIKRYGLNHLAMQETLARSIGVKRIEVKGDLFTVANNDCVEEARLQPENHVDLIVTSIPFANHYEYSPSYNDFGHTEDNDHFWAQMDHLTPELLRILKPVRRAMPSRHSPPPPPSRFPGRLLRVARPADDLKVPVVVAAALRLRDAVIDCRVAAQVAVVAPDARLAHVAVPGPDAPDRLLPDPAVAAFVAAAASGICEAQQASASDGGAGLAGRMHPWLEVGESSHVCAAARRRAPWRRSSASAGHHVSGCRC